MIDKSRSNSGQAIIEFAFVLPFLLILILGSIEFGVLFYDKAMITNASREGARAGIEYRLDSNNNYSPVSQAEIQAVVNNYLQSRLITFRGTASAPIDANARHGDSPFNGGNGYVEVVVRYTHTYLAIPRFAGWGSTINISARTRMRLE